MKYTFPAFLFLVLDDQCAGGQVAICTEVIQYKDGGDTVLGIKNTAGVNEFLRERPKGRMGT